MRIRNKEVRLSSRANLVRYLDTQDNQLKNDCKQEDNSVGEQLWKTQLYSLHINNQQLFGRHYGREDPMYSNNRISGQTLTK